MKNVVSKRGIFWTFVIGVFILTPLFTFLLDQRGYETPDNYEDIWPRKVDAVLYGKENPSGDASDYERLMSYDLLSPPEDEEEGGTEEDTAWTNAEAERLANWKANFPYQPTTDPDVAMTEKTIRVERVFSERIEVHCAVRATLSHSGRTRTRG